MPNANAVKNQSGCMDEKTDKFDLAANPRKLKAIRRFETIGYTFPDKTGRLFKWAIINIDGIQIKYAINEFTKKRRNIPINL
jgi:hypothetical protein